MFDIFKKTFVLPSAIILIIFGLIGVFSLASYNPYDPSWDVSTNAVIKNWAGVIGANLAPFYLSFIGFAGFYVSFVFVVWGGKLVNEIFIESKKRKKTGKDEPKTSPYLKIIYFIFSVIFMSSLLAIIDDYFAIPKEWGTNSNGGYLGFFIRDSIEPIIGFQFYLFIFTILAVVASLFAIGISFDSWKKFFSVTLGSIKSALKFIAKTIMVIFGQITSLFSSSEAKAEKEAKIKATSQSKIRKIIDSKETTKKATNTVKQESFDIDMQGNFQLPPISILSLPDDAKNRRPSNDSLSANAEILEKVLADFGVQGKILEVEPGPVVTRYSFEPSPGTKSSRIIGLADDIARSMTATSARISVIPGQNAIGVELPNSYRETVYLKELLTSNEYKKSKANLPLSLGKDISGTAVIIDLAKTPHLLVAGTTGAGKSVGLNAMILSLLYKYSPDECKFIMIDPKMLELSVYQDIPHLLSPVVTEPQKAIVALKWTVKEMENRYRLMSNLSVRNIDGYNEKIMQANKRGEVLTRTVQTGYDPDSGAPQMEEVAMDMKKLPYIVVVVDEMADLMLVAGKEIEASIQRLAQMARAAGIHVILATQRPSVDVITGIIKANFPSRVSYQVTSKIDSRTILGEMGAEQLLGMGDLLFMASGSKITRVHGPFVADGEVEEVANYLRAQGKPDYVDDVTTGDNEEMFMPSGAGGFGDSGGNEKDSLFDQAVAIVIRDNKVSTSYVQRALKIGYNRAANIIDQMEEDGIISEPDHVGRRKILAK